MKKYDAVIFDLDGTLLNTLDDLTDAVNHVMEQFNYPTHTINEVRSFVGNGIKLLIERSLPYGADTPDFSKIFDAFKQYYTTHCNIKTAPYNGIIDLLEMLSSDGYDLAIVSNKNNAAVENLNNIYFSKYISIAIGESENVKKKPAPDTVLKALEILDCEKHRAIYVGDSDVDFKTAVNAGIDCVNVSWGFRERAFLETFNPTAIIDTPLELKNYLI